MHAKYIFYNKKHFVLLASWMLQQYAEKNMDQKMAGDIWGELKLFLSVDWNVWHMLIEAKLKTFL